MCVKFLEVVKYIEKLIVINLEFVSSFKECVLVGGMFFSELYLLEEDIDLIMLDFFVFFVLLDMVFFF